MEKQDKNYYCQECGKKIIRFKSNYSNDWETRRIHKTCYKKNKEIVDIIDIMERNNDIYSKDIIDKHKLLIKPKYDYLTGKII